MNAVLPPDEALPLCRDLFNRLQNSESGKHMSTCGSERMVGILLCTDGTVLKAVSGKYDEVFSREGFVEPAYDVEAYGRVLEKYDYLIKNPGRGESSRDVSRRCWEELKQLYTFTCFDGKKRKLSDIYPSAPSGTGDCCAPKLLNACYSRSLKPLSMAEFYYDGKSSEPVFYEPCDSRCKGLLKHIIGFDLVYCDKFIAVVNKACGMLSIEGRGEDKQDCVASRVRSFFPWCIKQPCVHRLDQATSGLMVLGLTEESHRFLSREFEERRVEKSYEAVVCGRVDSRDGVIDLPIRLDTENRPCQVVDYENGKRAVTRFERIRTDRQGSVTCTRLLLIPETGRTHQLRVHCAFGLGHPIAGDRLYGGLDMFENPPSRLLLQARSLSFNHPATGERMSFTLERDF
ncbi:MAG: RluA family pseudouridine synthase [Sphaerochaetaceae bacterium]|nr:RluA family pseudouridine synthase [Sphaerochaetaceae bacterium]